jgi:tetratricopeptide (TPR) repeat protein
VIRIRLLRFPVLLLVNQMKNQSQRRSGGSKHCIVLFTLIALLPLFVSCEQQRNEKSVATKSAPVDSMAIVLALQPGEDDPSKEVSRLQQQIREGKNTDVALERLGWLYIKKARTTFDPGFYKMAEQCALALGSLQPHSPESLLLCGYALQNLHRFKEAEPLARELVARRGRAFDYGLLGDVLMEQGRLDEAIVTYQQMANIRPDLHTYTRAAHMRWLKGDLDGAIEAMQMAVQAASPRDAESAAWVHTRMALYQLQAGDFEKCRQYCDAALEFQTNYAPALLARGRLLLAQEKFSEAAEPLALAAKLNPLPEYQWALAEALRAANRVSEADAVERELKSRGAATDPRTFALFLATRSENISTAIALASTELDTRRDVFTHDALACSLAAAGRWSDAEKETQLALAEGTQDARLFLHAGMIANALSRFIEAETFFAKASALQQMLLPSEREQLRNVSRVISRTNADSSETKNKNQTNKRS